MLGGKILVQTCCALSLWWLWYKMYSSLWLFPGSSTVCTMLLCRLLWLDSMLLQIASFMIHMPSSCSVPSCHCSVVLGNGIAVVCWILVLNALSTCRKSSSTLLSLLQWNIIWHCSPCSFHSSFYVLHRVAFHLLLQSVVLWWCLSHLFRVYFHERMLFNHPAFCLVVKSYHFE